MHSKITNKVQIVSESGTYILPENYIKGIIHDYPNINMDYKIISIVGSQSSGKSTLLNAVFDTTFEVMNVNDGIRQTTKGVWGATLPSDGLFIMDVEGVDSKERWDEGAFFEKSTSLFSLAMSHLMIINLWTHDVGRFSGSNLKLLETIFEINFRLFHDKPKDEKEKASDSQRKGLLIILRDYNTKNNLEVIKETILNDIQKIWKEIIKPEKYREMSYDQFFNIQFETMAHYDYERPLFDSQCKELYKKLVNQNLPSSFFNYMKDYTNAEKVPVPFEALDFYIKNIWKTVRSCKDIDLPSQKIIVTDYRCRQISNELVKNQVNPQLEFINEKLNQNIYKELKPKCEELYNKTLETFDAQTSYYDQTVVLNNRKELEGQLKDRVQKFLRRQTEMIKILFTHQTKESIKGLKELPDRADFYKKWSTTKKKLLAVMENSFLQSDIQFAEYDIKKYSKELEEYIATSLDDLFKGELESYTQTFFAKEMKVFLTEKIRSLFEDPKIIFWEEFNKSFFALWKKVIQKYETTLMQGFNLSKQESDKQILELKKQVTELVTEKILDRKSGFIQYIRGIFEYNFKMHNGQERIWANCSKTDIANFYQVALEFSLRAADSFTSLEILDPDAANTKTDQSGQQDVTIIEALEFPKLFSESECENCKNVLKAQAESELLTAKLKSDNATWLQTLTKVSQVTKLLGYLK